MKSWKFNGVSGVSYPGRMLQVINSPPTPVNFGGVGSLGMRSLQNSLGKRRQTINCRGKVEEPEAQIPVCYMKIYDGVYLLLRHKIHPAGKLSIFHGHTYKTPLLIFAHKSLWCIFSSAFILKWVFAVRAHLDLHFFIALIQLGCQARWETDRRAICHCKVSGLHISWGWGLDGISFPLGPRPLICHTITRFQGQNLPSP